MLECRPRQLLLQFSEVIGHRVNGVVNYLRLLQDELVEDVQVPKDFLHVAWGCGRHSCLVRSKLRESCWCWYIASCGRCRERAATPEATILKAWWALLPLLQELLVLLLQLQLLELFLEFLLLLLLL